MKGKYLLRRMRNLLLGGLLIPRPHVAAFFLDVRWSWDSIATIR